MQRNIRVSNELSSKNINYNDIDMTDYTYNKNNKDIILNAFKKTSNLTYTDNGALTNKSSLNPLLDFFMLAGSMRNADEKEIINLFEKSLKFDKLMTLKCLFYIGDIREGLGERSTFNILLKHTAKYYPELLTENIHLIPFYSRWDYIYSLFNTSLESKCIYLIKKQLKKDLKSSTPSLLAKWLYSPNTSNKEKCKLGVKTALLLNLAGDNSTKIDNINKYRKTLTKLRNKLNVTESLMSKGKFNEINYEKVPSYAANRYSNCFYRNDTDRYNSYIDDLLSNKAKVNSKTLYPHNIVRPFLNNENLNHVHSRLLEHQWLSLPDYVDNKDTSALCVVDVSGSMSSCNNGIPLEVAISLGLYMSERCSGPYKNKFLTFSKIPELVEITGNSLSEKVKNMSRANWSMNTNIKSLFDIILNTAIENDLPQNALPKYLYILSDMQFDSIDNSYSSTKTLFEFIKEEYEHNGYSLPMLVYWNLNASNCQSPMTIDDNGWVSISGFSTNILKSLMNEEFLNLINQPEEIKITKNQKADAIELMNFTLNNKRYDLVII